MMNLKEAFRFQNKLQALMDYAQGILGNEANVTQVKDIHLRHKVNPEYVDETEELTPESEFSDQITEIVGFLFFLLGEKQKLAYAVRAVKNALSIDMDSETGLNATRQNLARTLKAMNDIRSTEQVITNGGFGLKFNADGNQVSYRCDLRRVTTINFDRNVVRERLKELNKKSDETSTQLDLCLVTSQVDYDSPFDVNSSFAEAFEEYRHLRP